MIRNALAGLAFALLYGAGMRLYFYLRAGRDSHRWHLPAVAAASLFGGAGFYLAQQIRSPHLPQLLDVAAFAIMVVAAAAIPAILETARVVQVRLLRDARLAVPPGRGPHDEPPADRNPAGGGERSGP